MVWDGTRWVRDTAAAHAPGADAPRPRRRIRWSRVVGFSIAALVVGSLVGAALPVAPSAATSATLTLDPATAPAGATVHLVGEHLLAYVTYQVTWDGSATAEPQVVTDGQGVLRTDWVVPVAAAGPHTLSVFPVGHVSSGGVADAVSSSFLVAIADDATAPPVAILPSVGLPEPSTTPTSGPSATGAPAADPTHTPAGGHAPPPPTPRPVKAPPPDCRISLQGLIDAAPSGSTLIVPACVYRESVTVSKPLTISGKGAVIDGRNSSGSVVRSSWMRITSSNVTVTGFTMRYANNAPQTGALQTANGVRNVVISNCDLSYAHGADVSIGGASYSRVVSCRVHHGGQEGVHVGGSGGTGNLVANNTIYDNNTAGFNVEVEAGGMKAAGQTDLTVSGNVVYGNNGPGLWCDIHCHGWVVKGNRIYGNAYAGIMFEISDGATISGNVVWKNGWSKTAWGWGAGILISSSRNADVSGNTVAWNASGISVISQNRGDAPGPVTGDYVHGNTIVGQPGRFLLAWLQDWGGVMYASSSGNHGAADHYYVTAAENGQQRFEWNASAIGSLGTFNGTPGEESGAYLSAAGARSVLAGAGVPTSP
ncbi:MAG TPA: right-handed parallel beta-helix repeat-containing protein [Candidatus Limnocylindrales bacterium]|jgi:parallel beta-helix repeat protein